MSKSVNTGCKFLALLMACLFSIKVKCQQIKPRPKIASFVLNQLPSRGGDDYALVGNANLRFPLLMKSNVSVFGELRYRSERLINPLQTNAESFDELKLKHYSTSLLYKIDLGRASDLLGNLRLARQGDTNFGDLKTQLSISSIYRHQLSDKIKVGGGVRYQDRFLIPVIFYQQQFANNFRLHMLLPKEVRLTKMNDFGQLIYASAELQTASYDLHTYEFSNELTTYDRLGVDFKIGIEKSIIDWIWIGGYAGLGMPLRNAISCDSDILKSINLMTKTRPIVGLSLFIVPPSSWVK